MLKKPSIIGFYNLFLIKVLTIRSFRGEGEYKNKNSGKGKDKGSNKYVKFPFYSPPLPLS
ncbi:hypothetical protein ABE25_04095 [Cytobacillus firmus]|nr:hypothetical protein [Cytobacillus firmus]MBG9601413.1 hypothetical protein [Cytobacillus firmus]